MANLRFLCLGDLHITDKTPESRIDNYPETLIEKIKWILDFAYKSECDYILQPGDFFDSSQANNELLRVHIAILKTSKVPILAVLGQHDQRFHNQSVKNTPIGVLDAAGVVKIIDSPIKINGVNIYGASWESEIAVPENRSEYNVLVCHKMIISDEKLWAGQSGHVVARPFLLQSGFDLIVSGDNHQGFHVSNKAEKKHLINCGSLMRSSISQISHYPIVYLVDSINNEIDRIPIPVKNIKDVMDLANYENEKKKLEEFYEWSEKEKERLDKYIVQLSNSEKKLDYKKQVFDYISENKIDKKVKSIIENIFQDL